MNRKPNRYALGAVSKSKNRWAIVLAGGDGTRLRSLTRSITGDERPKQFCPLIGRKTLLEQTHDRVAFSFPENQILTVLTETHERYYKQLELDNWRGLSLIQPSNKGTAPAILYSLLRVAAFDPEAVIAVFPSDHYFSDEQKFMSYVEKAIDGTKRDPETVILLGIAPEVPEVEFGWIEPQTSILNTVSAAVTRVRRFWEKPSAGVARKLMERGSLWNSFVMVGTVKAFLKMTRRAQPELYTFFEALIPWFGCSSERANIRELYSWIPDINFSHEVLSVRPDDLSVMRVEHVGWNDLGDPSRVLTTLGRIGSNIGVAASAG